MVMQIVTATGPIDRFFISEGLRIHYLDWGGAGRQPLLLLHGIGRTAHNYDPVARHFHRRYHVIAPDLRGHGDSDWHPAAAYLVEDYVRDVAALIDELGLDNLVIMGQSTGGRVAQVLAGTRQSQVAAVIVEDVGPERPKEVSDRREQRMGAEENGWATPEEALAAIRPRYPRTAEALLREFIAHGMRRRGDGRLVWKCDRQITKGFVPTEIWDQVREIQAPIAYILGGESNIVPAATQEALREALAQVEIITLPGLGHYPSEEDPAAYLAAVERFLG